MPGTLARPLTLLRPPATVPRVAFILDLIRHGEAEPTAPGGDAQRALTAHGRADVRTLAEMLAAGAWRPDLLFASPYVRAQQTAAILARHGAPDLEVETLPGLGPDGEPGEVILELLARRPALGHVVLVGHMPMLGLMTGDFADEPRAFATAQLCRMEFAAEPAPGEGTVTLTLRPPA